MLVPKTDQTFDSLADLLASSKQKLADFAKYNKGGVFESNKTVRALLVEIVLLLGSIGTWIAVPFVGDSARVPVIIIASLFTIACTVVTRMEKKILKKGNDGAEVALGAFIQGLSEVFEPGDGDDDDFAYPCFGLVTTDPALERDPGRLVDLAERLGALRSTDIESLSPELRELRDYLDSEEYPDYTTWRKVPAEFAGSDKAWAIDVGFARKHMPQGHVDRRLWFILYHRDHIQQLGTTTLPLDFWWSEANDHLFFPESDGARGSRDEEAQDVG